MDDTMNKRPSLQFYPADWLKDPDLQICSMNTIGIWINLMCRMWEAKEEGILCGKSGELALLVGARPTEFKRFLREAETHLFADVTNCDGIVTIKCRRMNRVYMEREGAKQRMKRHRGKQCNANVTIPSSSSTTTSKNIYDIFESFREKYPGTKRGLEEEFQTFTQKHKDWKKTLDKLLPALEQQIIRRRGLAAAGEFVPPWKHLKTWLNNRCWTEEGMTKEEETKRLCKCGCGREATFLVSHEWFATDACRKKIIGW